MVEKVKGCRGIGDAVGSDGDGKIWRKMGRFTRRLTIHSNPTGNNIDTVINSHRKDDASSTRQVLINLPFV